MRIAKLSWSTAAVLVAALAALAVAALILLGVLAGDEDHGLELKLGTPTEASVSDLRAFSSKSRPVYWIGPPKKGRLEVTKIADGSIFVRYLPPDVELGSPASNFTTIGTYPKRAAHASLLRALRRPNNAPLKVGGGAVGLWLRNKPASVYLAYPGVDYEIEVYDPSPRRARSLAQSGKVERVP